MTDELKLNPDDLAWRCDPAQFEFSSTKELPPLQGTIGQDRALTAIEFGLGIKDSGFNVFILGEPGTGRSSTIKNILAQRAQQEPVPSDWCYLNDFTDGARPSCISMPAGVGRDLHKDMEALVVRFGEEIPSVFESKEYEHEKNTIAGEYQEKNRQVFEQLEAEAHRNGFVLQRSVSGLVLVPTRNGEPLSQQDYENLPKAEQEAFDQKGTELQGRLNEVMRKIRDLEAEARAATVKMEKALLLDKVNQLFEELEKKYAKHPKVIEHFERCKKDLLDRVDEFRPSETPTINLPGLKNMGQEPSFDRYRVNLFIDNSAIKGAPVVYEANPTYFNLFGRIEHIIQMGNATTNFTMIKPGALHRANGGYLILDCREVLINLFTYEALKRSIRNGEIKIEDMAEQFRLIATVSLKPQPVPLDCKIILIGTHQIYYLLYQLDPDFRKYFKVKADFDRMMKNTWENVQQYALFVATKCQEEKLTHFAPSGVSRLVEYSSRLIEDKQRLSSRFIDIADLIREAAYYADREDQALVGADHVDLAIEAKAYRSNKVEERIQEFIEDGTILVDVDGGVIGQVNGLSVYMLGDYSFGKPSRVTVRTYLGKTGMVNIEREAKLSGPIHDKGVMILTGFFGERFAQDKPLTLAASICFEQSYAGVEGDSASSTELYALLSSLSRLPLRQGVAVTGSVNQRGMIQPIGGVNEKIEGFYDVCKALGFSGEQGVIIPVQNTQHLMLRQEVIDAVAQGRFHIWAIATIDQGIEILTGTPAGERQEDGSWPEGSVNALVDQRLRELAEAVRKFGKGQENGK